MNNEIDAKLYVDFSREWLEKTNNSFNVCTSGSTGRPKVISLSRTMMKESALRTINFFGIDRDWLLLSCISAKFIGGKMMTVRALEADASFQSEPPSNLPSLSKAHNWPGKVLIAVVPSQMWHILSLPLTDSDKSRFKFIIGGSAIPQDLRNRITESGLQAWETYGMTETASHIALRKITDTEDCFLPLPDIKLKKSEEGTLIIKMSEDLCLLTNDLVEFEANGGFHILGRADNVIITGGLKIIPESLEKKIRLILEEFNRETLRKEQCSPLSGFTDVMITSVPDPKWSEAITLLVEFSDTDESESDVKDRKIHSDKADEDFASFVGDLLRNHLQSEKLSLQRHEIPKHIIRVNKLPRTSNGKIMRKWSGKISAANNILTFILLCLYMFTSLLLSACHHSPEVSPASEIVYIPVKPNYDDPTMWVISDNDEGEGADVFYIPSTWEYDWYTSDNKICHYADPSRIDHRDDMRIEIDGVAEYMANGNNFYSPFYRHITLDSWATLNEDTINRRYNDVAFEDVQNAFNHFIEKYNNNRPFILAGFSQGGKSVVELLKQMNEETRQRMIAAYVLGYKVTPEDIRTHPYIKGASDSIDTGVVICYNSVSDIKYIKPIVAAPNVIGINPVNWRTDDVPAILNDTITVTLHPVLKVLVLDGFDGSYLPNILDILNVGDYHGIEPWVYSECLRKNFKQRINSYKIKQPKQ